MDRERWAAAHYRVERDSSGAVMRKRQRRRATEVAIQHGDPVPAEPHDVVRIYDRAGNVVFEHNWGASRSGAMAQEARIVEDLLHLDVLMFRARYGIREVEEKATGDAGSAVPDPSVPDPSVPGPSAPGPSAGAATEWGRPGRPEQGSG